MRKSCKPLKKMFEHFGIKGFSNDSLQCELINYFFFLDLKIGKLLIKHQGNDFEIVNFQYLTFKSKFL